MTCLTQSTTTSPQTSKQPLTLQSAERLIRRRATPSDADDLVDLFKAEISSGVPVPEALAGVQQWIEEEANPTPTPKITRGHTPGFAIVPAELLQNRDFMEAVPHDLRVFLQLLQHSSGGKTTAFPATKTLANNTFIEDSSSVRRSLRNLEKQGWIQTLEPQSGRRAKTRRIMLPSNPDNDRPQLGHQPSAPFKKKEEIQKKTTTTQLSRVVPSLTVTNKSGGGFSTKSSKQKPPVTELTSTIVNGQTLPGASKTTLRLVENLLNRANLPTDIATGILRTTAQAAEAGNIKTSADRYIGGLIGRYRDGCYMPEQILQQETATEKASALAKVRQEQEATEKIKDELETAQKQELETVKAQLTAEELEQYRGDYIEQLRQNSDLHYKRLRADGFTGFAFDLGLNGYLRRKLLTE
jgi:hypothetical protein